MKDALKKFESIWDEGFWPDQYWPTLTELDFYLLAGGTCVLAWVFCMQLIGS